MFLELCPPCETGSFLVCTISTSSLFWMIFSKSMESFQNTTATNIYTPNNYIRLLTLNKNDV